MSRILRFFALVAVVFFSVNAFAGDPYGSCSAKKVYTDCAEGYVLQNGECVPDSSGSCSAGQYWNGSACAGCPSTHPNSAAGASSESECYKTAELMKNGGSGTCFGKTGTLDGAFTCYYGSTCALPSWNSSFCNMTNGSKIFKGWSLSDDATTGTTGDFVHGNTYYAVWVTPSCNITNGTGEVISPLNNKPRCEVTCDSGYGTSGTYTGSAGGTNITFACTLASDTCSEGQYWDGSACQECTSGYYCPGGTWTGTAVQGLESCPAGYENSEPGSVDESDCYLTTTAGKYVATPESAETTCAENGYCPGGIDVSYGDTDGRMACIANSSSPAGSDEISDCQCNVGYFSNSDHTACVAITYTVTYNANGGYGATASSSHKYDEAKALSHNAFARDGYTFAGWATSPSGDVVYTNQQSVINLASTQGAVVTLYAHWTGRLTTVKFDANGGTGGQTDDVTATYGSPMPTISTTPPTRTGYTFMGWYDDAQTSGTQYYTATGESARTCDAQVTLRLYARWRPNTYTVVYYPNGGSGTTASSSLQYGEVAYLTSNGFTRTGHAFAGWATSPSGDVVYTNKQRVSNLASTQGAEVALYAKWTAFSYAISFNANGGTGGQTGLVSATYGSQMPTISTTPPTRTGYAFQGWYDAQTGGTQYYTAAGASARTWDKTAGATLYAQWTANTYTVQYNANGGSGTTASSTHEYDVAKALTANEFTRTGYTFAGWATSSSGDVVYTDQQSVTNLTSTQGATVNLYAQWTQDCYKITLDSKTNGGTGGRTALYKTYNSTLWYRDSSCSTEVTTTTKPSKTNASFGGYYTSASGGTQYINYSGQLLSKTVTGPITLYARYICVGNWGGSGSTPSGACTGTQSTVSFNANGGTGGQTSNVTATYGSEMPTISTTKPTRTGYTFNGWYDAQTGGTLYYTAAGASARTWDKAAATTLYAGWTANTYTVSFDVNGGTGGQTDPVTATYGSQMPTISTTAPTRTGYTFSGWYDAETGGTQYYTAAGDSARDWDKATNTTLYAQWTLSTYTISFNANGGTGGQTDDVTATYGSEMPTISPTAPTRTGYTFNGWYDAQTGGTQYYTAAGDSARTWNKTADTMLYAQWTAGNYSIVLSPGSGYNAAGTTTLYTRYDTNVYLDSNRSQAMTTNANNITKPIRNGYTFGGYYSGSDGTGTEYIDANGYITSAGLSAGKECTSCTWYAKWTLDCYKITLDNTTNGGTGGTTVLYKPYRSSLWYSDSSCSTQVTTITKPTKTNAIYSSHFTSVSGGGTQYISNSGNLLSWTVTGPITLYARYNCETNWLGSGTEISGTCTGTKSTVSFDANGGTGGQTNTVTATYGSDMPTISTTAPTRTGYTFDGWYSAQNGGNQYYTATGESARTWDKATNTTLYAKWTAITYTVKYNANGGSGTTTSSSHTYDVAKTLMANGFYRTGYTFAGWATSSSGDVVYTDQQSVINLASTQGATVNLYAKWTGNTYTVSFNVNGGTGGQTDPVTATYGSNMPTISTTAPTRTGYTFNGWYDAQTGGTKYYNANGTSARTWNKTTGATLYARWTGNTYTVSFDANGGTGGQTYNVAATYGSLMPTLTTAAPTRTGYTFGGWYDAQTGGTLYYTVGGTSSRRWDKTTDATLYARWIGNTYTVSFNANGGTGGQTADVTATYGSQMPEISTTAPTRTGYTFSGWYDAETGGTQYYTAAGDSARDWDKTATTTLYAQWTVNTYKCTSGQYLNVTSCATCTAGYYCPSSAVTYTYNGSVQGRTECGGGKYSSAGATSCSNITAGCYGTSASSSCPAVCAANTYSDAGASSCSSCPTDYKNSGDTAASHAGSASCKITVSGGYYIGTSGDNSSNWDKCAGGTYKASHTVAYGSTSSCATCSAGYYCPEGASSQTACGGNTKYSSSGASSCSTVSSGYYSTGGTSTTRTGQTKCEAGNYCSGGVKTACGGGKYSSAGATSCSNITAGCYGTSASSSCPAVCAANTYSDAGASACTSCDSDYANSGTDATSHAGVASCKVTCAAGTYVASANAACTDVGSGYYTTASQTISQGSMGSRSACSSLNAFYTASDSGRNATTDCYGTTSSGKYVSTAKSGEVTCAAGGYCAGSVKVYYNSTGGRTACGAGKYNASTGSSASSACTNITAGCYGTSASSSCPAVCAANTYSDAGASSCSSCPTDYKNSGDTAASHAGSASCIITVSGGYYIGTSGDNSSNWDKCACGTYKASHTVAYGSTSSCATTDAGYYAAAGASSQTKATAGYYAAAGACSQTACSGRTKYSAAGAASCSTVSTGYYTTGCNSSSNACTSQTICAKGTYCSSGVAYDCPGGTYGSTTGLSTNACSGKCTAGYYCPAGSASATQNACATNATSAAGSDAISDCVCKAGYSGDASTSSGTCTACACGYYKGSTGNTSCTKTTAGYYATGTGNTGQTKATAGNYAAAGACSQSSCADLGGGLYSSSAAGSDATNDCYATVPATKYLSSSTSTSFTTCTAGYYCPGKTLYYASTGGRTACGGGKYSEEGSDASSDCKTISAGCYGSSAGSACPNTCAPGSYSTGGASGCTICGNKPTNSSYTDATGNTSADCPWTCNDGYNQTSDNQCGQFCTAGITHIKSSDGLSVPLYSSARTSPAINVKVNDSVCYGSLATGQSSGALNVRVGSTTYYAID